MESIDVGFLSIIPPIIAIVLALITKEVISSLSLGILSGTLIYAVHTANGFGNTFISTFSTFTSLMADRVSSNIDIILFLCLLGSIVVIVTKSGGSKAYANWANKKIKSREMSMFATSILGALIFIDDYFNCLTVGTVMRPITDRYKVSHAKLAYIIDSTAAPICIIAPVSSWAASVISQIDEAGLNGIEVFIQSIPFNLYAILTLLMVFIVCFTKIDFGPMVEFEKQALEHNNLNYSKELIINSTEKEEPEFKISEKGSIFDLVLPILVLIVTSVLSMLYVGGYFDGGMTLSEGFGNTDAGPALVLSGFITILFTMVLMISRKVLSFKEFIDSIGEGCKSMVGAIITLTLAWTISGVCRQLLGTGNYVGDLVANSSIPSMLIPAIIFLVSGALSFSIGTSWGTFGILIPIVTVVCEKVAPELIVISLSATLAGAVLGDHCSPISDTTILSSTGSECNHISHVLSQIPYALVVGVATFIGYIVAGFTQNLVITLITSIVVLFLLIFIIKKIINKNEVT